MVSLEEAGLPQKASLGLPVTATAWRRPEGWNCEGGVYGPSAAGLEIERRALKVPTSGLEGAYELPRGLWDCPGTVREDAVPRL